MNELSNSKDNALAEMAQLRAMVESAQFHATLGDFVSDAARRYGSKIAVRWIDEGRELSYADLDTMSLRLASALLSIGVRKGTHVAVMVGNTEAYPVTWVALSRIGAVIIPINTAYKSHDLKFVLSDSDALFFVLDEVFLPLYESLQDTLPLISQDQVIVNGKKNGHYHNWLALLEQGTTDFIPPSMVGPNDLLNIQYTSGTTGFPKGCLLNHDYWLLITAFAAAPLRSRDDIKNLLIWQPFYYMDGMWLLLLSIRIGATAYVARNMRLHSFYEWLERYQVNYCIFPEAALKIKSASSDDKKLALRYLSIYGWRTESRLEAKSRFGACVREGYGMTEIGLVTVVPNAADDMALKKTCGLAGPFRELRIVDENSNDVPNGTSGELWVSGRSIIWGYYKRPEANRTTFRNGWFRTGDIFYRDDAGYYYLVGRSKDMIKRSGENIAAREVEATISTLDPVREAAVVGVPDPLRTEEVKVYILLRDGFTADDCSAEEIIDHCARNLASFKVPRYVTYVDEFPRTPSGKVRKHELLALDTSLCRKTYDRLQTRKSKVIQ